MFTRKRVAWLLAVAILVGVAAAPVAARPVPGSASGITLEAHGWWGWVLDTLARLGLGFGSADVGSGVDPNGIQELPCQGCANVGSGVDGNG